SLAPWFSTARTVLADHGVLWALLHPRGGGEFGRNWYESGRLHNKQNTFGDVIACVEYLRDSYVDPARIGLRGGSAGGALVGACITQRPELFALGIAEVPFVDVVTTMSDPTLPLTATEWEEWGDPRRVDAAEWIGAWSPYDNTHPAAYPAMFVTAGLHDPRVGYHEPAKWVARLRDMTTSAAPILLRTELDGGHAGPTDRYAAWADEADIIAFTLDVFGLANTGHDTVPTPTR
ncbi:MAG: oligopeptidase B, partial [Gammaproteobacteria bacterium]|nr:oligopeptidase B [Gammaproteobacteria bacterium]